MPVDVREYKRTLKRLYLELIPPLVSVSTLIGVTVFTIHDAMQTLFESNDDAENNNTEKGDDEMVGDILLLPV